jgi:hypothetical protein
MIPLSTILKYKNVGSIGEVTYKITYDNKPDKTNDKSKQDYLQIVLKRNSGKDSENFSFVLKLNSISTVTHTVCTKLYYHHLLITQSPCLFQLPSADAHTQPR